MEGGSNMSIADQIRGEFEIKKMKILYKRYMSTDKMKDLFLMKVLKRK